MRTANGVSKPAAPKAAAKKSQAATTADAGPADNDDAALAGGTLSDIDLKERMQALLGEEIYTGLLVSSLQLSHQVLLKSKSLWKAIIA